jgi:hypothetical protein
MKTNLQKARERYDKVCEKLETLNEEATQLETDIMLLKRKEVQE